jgi:hypothetical protein
MRNAVLALSVLLSLSGSSQDSTKVIHQEFGFNMVSLLQQVKAFQVTESQLPYDVIYSIYYRDLAGLRFGAGMLSTDTRTEIEGQEQPRVTVSGKSNFRAGVTYNFVRSTRLHFNCFADYLWLNSSLVTTNSSTVQVFPDPIVTRTVRSSDETRGSGLQGGVGVQVKLWKYLSLYAETSFIYTVETREIEDLLRESGVEDVTTRSSSTIAGTRIALPATVYLVLRF